MYVLFNLNIYLKMILDKESKKKKLLLRLMYGPLALTGPWWLFDGKNDFLGQAVILILFCLGYSTTAVLNDRY